jgi:hypothetical protein
MPYAGLEPTPESLVPELEKLEQRTKELTAGFGPEAMNWRPPDGGWSIAQLFEHLTVSTEIYFPLIRSRLAGSTANPARLQAWKPSLWGRVLIRSLQPTTLRKLPAPRIIRPGAQARANVVSEFLRALRETAELVRQARGHDLRRLRFPSPVSALLRGFNVGDAFLIIVVHAQRHLKQIERVQAHPAFPAGVVARRR